MQFFRAVLVVLLATHAGPAAAAATCDDGNAATTDSCITGLGCEFLGTSAGTDTVLQGNATGGTLYADGCPAGQVMIGVAGTIGASWDQIQVVCGIPTMTDSLGISISAGATLPLRGTNVSTAVTALCPTDQMVVGFDGRAGALMDQIALRCAPAMAAFSSGTYTVTLATATDQTPVGGTGGTAFATTDCPAGQLAIGANIRAGSSNDAFGLICGAFSAVDGLDADCDGIPDNADNCRAVSNPDQADTDMDRIGDVCDSCPAGGAAGCVAVSEGGTPLSSGTTLDFGSQSTYAGPTSARTLTITNSGTAAVTLGMPTTEGPAASAFVADLTGYSTSVPAGGTTTLAIAFDPSIVGTAMASISFTHDDAAASPAFLVNLTGTGVSSDVGGGASGGYGHGGGCSTGDPDAPPALLLALTLGVMLWSRRRA